MNEEEKQAIKELKHFTNMTVFWKEKEYTSHEIDNYINIVLHLIDKQQKEIEKLKSRKYMFNAETNEIKEIPISDNYVIKDKIRKFIEEYLPDDEIMETCSMYDVNGIYVREELEKILGE